MRGELFKPAVIVTNQKICSLADTNSIVSQMTELINGILAHNYLGINLHLNF